MGLQIEKSFTVRAPRSAVWAFLTDPYKVASCLPGAAITEKLDDSTYAGTMTVKVGPVTASYRGKLRFERLDDDAGQAEIAASGQETRGKGGADMRMKSSVREGAPGETEVTVLSDVNVMGVLAQFGRGMIQDVSDQLFGRFTEAMRRQLEAPGASAGSSGASAGSSAAAPAAPAASAPAPSTPAPASPQLAAATTVAPAVSSSAPTAVSSSAPTAPWPVPAATGPGSPTATAAPPPPPPTRPAPAPVEPLDVGALGAAAAGRAAARTLRRPGFWVALAVIALVLYWWFH